MALLNQKIPSTTRKVLPSLKNLGAKLSIIAFFTAEDDILVHVHV